jgi:hypothetical protein
VAASYRGDIFTYQASPSSPPISGGEVQDQSSAKARVGRVKARGLSAWVPLECVSPSNAFCDVSLAMFRRTALVGKKRALLGAGEVRTVRIKLNSIGRNLLKRRGKLSVRLRIAQATNGGTIAVSGRGLTFKLAPEDLQIARNSLSPNLSPTPPI